MHLRLQKKTLMRIQSSRCLYVNYRRSAPTKADELYYNHNNKYNVILCIKINTKYYSFNTIALSGKRFGLFAVF